MSDTLTVPTSFADIAELAAGLAERVDEERLMLYGPSPVDEGEWIRFSVLLADDSPALEGMGRAVASIDGGDDRPEMVRFDIVLDSLQLEARAEVVYERILLKRQSILRGDPPTGQIRALEVDAIEDAASESAEALDSEWSDEATNVADTSEVFVPPVARASAPRGAAPAGPPSAPPPLSISGDAEGGGILGRPRRQSSWAPPAAERAEPRPSSGLFAYPPGELPIPPKPPRPDLPPSQRVSPAPRPGDESQKAGRGGGRSAATDDYSVDLVDEG